MVPQGHTAPADGADGQEARLSAAARTHPVQAAPVRSVLLLKRLCRLARGAGTLRAPLLGSGVLGDGDQRTMTCRVRDEAGKIVLLASLVLMIQGNA